MFKWLFHILIFATSDKYQNKDKPLKRQRKFGLVQPMKTHPFITETLLMGRKELNQTKFQDIAEGHKSRVGSSRKSGFITRAYIG